MAAGDRPEQRGAPSEAGPTPRVTLYTRQGCHLCEDAHRDLTALGRELGFELEVVDIDLHPALVDRYGDSVPVIHVNGRLACKVRVDRGRILRRLRQP